jgi:ubiquinone/menaquinone biosynthesis C-methylase UbiE
VVEIKHRQRKHYDRLFREYEEKSRRSAYMRLVRSRYSLERWLPRLSGGRVLDLGCGYGDTAARLDAAHCVVTGLDLSYQFVRRAREYAGDSKRASWVQSDAERLPFESEAFDAVVSFGTLHHLSRPGLAIEQIARVLKPGGWLFAMEPNPRAARSTLEFYGVLIPPRLRRRLEQWRASREYKGSEAESEAFHVGRRTPAEYVDLATRAGLCARVHTRILAFFPFTLFGLHRYVVTWQIAAWVSSGLMKMFPSLHDRGLVQIVEASKVAPDALPGCHARSGPCVL